MGVRDRRPGHLPLARHEPRPRPGAARGYILYAGSNNTWQLWTGSGGFNVVAGPPVSAQHLDAPGRHLRRDDRASVRERDPCRLRGRRLPAEHRPPTAGSRAATPTAPPTTTCPGAWTRSRCTALRCRRPGSPPTSPPQAPAAAVTSPRWPWPAPRPRAGRSPSPSSSRAPGSSDPRRHHRKLRLGSRRRRRLRRLERRQPELPVHGGRQLQRAPARHRQPGRTRRLRPAHDHRPDPGRRRPHLLAAGARRHPGRLLAPGRGERHHRRRLLGSNRTGSYLNTPTLGLPGALAGDTNTAAGFNGTNEYVSVPYRGCAQPGLLHGRGVGVRDRRPGHLPLARHEPRPRGRRRERLHPVRGLQQQLAAVDGLGRLQRLAGPPVHSTPGHTWSAATTGRPRVCT